MSAPCPEDRLRAGQDGVPVPAGQFILRLARIEWLQQPEDRVSPQTFALSPDERNAPVQRLTVWVEALTEAYRAWELLGSPVQYRRALRLGVDGVCGIQPDPLHPPTPALEVHWEPATVKCEAGTFIPDNREGADGHAGIANLDRGQPAQRRSFRSQLADIARVIEIPEGPEGGKPLSGQTNLAPPEADG